LFGGDYAARMHHVEIEDFYHHDFTTVSEWEVFIARLEEVMHEWKLAHTKAAGPLKPEDFANCQWDEASEKLNFAGTFSRAQQKNSA